MPDIMPSVSVIIPVYNGASWIGHALRSVFAQTYRDFEVIVVDDGSTDDLVEALRPWAGQITFTRQSNGGPAKARNAGITLATGRLIAFLDADDEWLPEKLALQVAYFERYPETGLLHTALVGRRTRLDVHTSDLEPPRFRFCPLFHTDFFIRTLTVMVPKAVLQEVGGFDERRELHVEDWDLWLRIAARHPIGYLARPLALHRPGGHMSTKFDLTFAGQALVIEKNRGLCEAACPEHRRAPDQCFRARHHLLYRSWGIERFAHGNRDRAREAFARALRLQPWRPGTYARYAACYLPERWQERVRALKRTLGFSTPGTVRDRPRPVLRRTLMHDTAYGRARGRTVRALRSIDDAAMRALRSRRRVLFEAASPMSFCVFQPVYRRLCTDPRLDFWFTAPGRAWKPTDIFSAVGIENQIVSADRARWSKWDLCVNTDFWEMTSLHRAVQRVHLFHGVAGKYDLDAPLDLAPELAMFTSVMFANEDRLRRYVDAGLVPREGPTAALVGYPKTDALVDGSLDRTAICASLRLDPGRPTVLYAPTWSPHSSLNLMGEQIIDSLAATGWHVIVKLHDRSYDRVPRASGGVDWAQRLSRYAHDPLVRVVRGADATPFLFAADVLVTDHSSVGFEFMLLDRPIVVVDCPELLERSRVNPEKVRQLRATADVIRSHRDLPDAVTAALVDPTRRSRERSQVASALFYGPGTATDRAVAIIYSVLGLEPPASTEAVRADVKIVTAA